MQAGVGALADRVQAGHPGVPVQVGRDPAHEVVGGGGDGHELALGVEAGVAQGLDDVREQGRVDRAHVEVDVPHAGLLQLGLDGAGDLVAGLELVDEALAVGVEERGALAADRLGDEEAVDALGGAAAELVRAAGDHRGGVELDELEVG